MLGRLPRVGVCLRECESQNHGKVMIATLLQRYEQFGRQRPLLFAFVIVAITMLGFGLVFTPAYPIGDDPMMSMIASGRGIALEPDEHLVFTNVTIGLALKQLYRAMPDVPWYGAYLLAVHYFSHVALLYSVVSWRFGMRYLVLYAVFFIAIGQRLICNLQFTSTAALAVQAGIVLCLTRLCRRAERPAESVWRGLAAGTLLIVFGSLVRIESFYAMMLIGAPVSAWVVLGGRRWWVIRPALIAATIMAVAVIGLQIYHARYYENDPAWAGFYDYNKLRIKFNDYEWTYYSNETKPVFDRVGWSENDHAMIVSWFFADADRYSPDKLRQVVDGFPWKSKQFSTASATSAVREIVGDRSLVVLLMLAPFFFWQAYSMRIALAGTAVSLAMATSICLFLALTAKIPPPRVYFPLFAFPATLMLLLSRVGPRGSQDPMGTLPVKDLLACFAEARHQMRPSFGLLAPMAVSLLLIWGVGLAGYYQYRRSREATKENSRILATIEAMQPSDDKLFITWSDSFGLRALGPLDRPTRLARLRMLNLAWPLHTPIHRRMMEKFAVDDLAAELLVRPDLYLISKKTLLPIYDQYVREHHQTRAQASIAIQTEQFGVYQMRVAENPNVQKPVDDARIAEQNAAGYRR